ncbi:MAG: hypothetical protein J6S58_04190, partial [Lentisphaeria bacterium]|nr:hypothetical protein [Lentisphaeria bacterium]
PEMYERVKAHLLKGGKILTSGKSALMEHSGNFPEEWGVDYKAETAFTPAYFRTKVPGIHVNMDLSFYGKAYEVEARSASNVPSVLVRPAVNNGWDGVYPEYYNPPSEETTLPFLTLSNGNLAHFSGEIFKGYDLKAAVPVRDLVKYALDSIQFKPLIRLEKAPFFIKAYVGKDEEQKRVMVSFLSCLPEKRGLEMESCEGDLPSGIFQLCLKTDQDPVKVYMAQDEANALPFYRDGEYLCVQIPGVTGFGMAVFEFGSGK